MSPFPALSQEGIRLRILSPRGCSERVKPLPMITHAASDGQSYKNDLVPHSQPLRNKIPRMDVGPAVSSLPGGKHPGVLDAQRPPETAFPTFYLAEENPKSGPKSVQKKHISSF